MSNLLATPKRTSQKQQALACDQPHFQTGAAVQIADALQAVQASITPVWPLKDYVAVNPYAAFGTLPLMFAQRRLQDVSDCELLPSLEHFAAEFTAGRIDIGSFHEAITQLWRELELTEAPDSGMLDAIAGDLTDQLSRFAVGQVSVAERAPESVEPGGASAFVISAALDHWQQTSWGEFVEQEVGKFCAAYFDEGQASWSHPGAGESLFSAWRLQASCDRTADIMGLGQLRKLAAKLPADANSVIKLVLSELHVPQTKWEEFLLAHVLTLPGWFAYARYLVEQHGDADSELNPFQELLAVRLVYELALSKKTEFSIDWTNVPEETPAPTGQVDGSLPVFSEQEIRYLCLRASELSYQKTLLARLGLSGSSVANSGIQRSSLLKSKSPAASKPAVRSKMVFCIDVRSERYRRNLEACYGAVETVGFAGFFGVPMELSGLSADDTVNQLPVLLQPQFTVQEGVLGEQYSASRIAARRREVRFGRKLWKSFATGAASCYTFVETSGLLFGGRLLKRSLGRWKPSNYACDGVAKQDKRHSSECASIGPTLRGLNSQGITTSRQVDLAASILTGSGMTKDLPRLVVFCGHESRTENNPLAASLDCGACGGHSGESNARFAAMLLNQTYIRNALADRGIEIPAETHFMAAVHNTTTDHIEFHDQQDVPSTHVGELEDLSVGCEQASGLTQLERSGTLSDAVADSPYRRASEWSEVRPEWGLAGNASFIAGPRELTQPADLEGRAFLHSYNHSEDTDGSVLELIMTAPMVVAHWINMQYYASSVDPKKFGSGSKTIHNVVGNFGIWSGQGGDLKTGLPWESVSDGQQLEHKPVRLLSVVCAPREAIERVLAKHDFLRSLVANRWIHLISVEDGVAYRYLSQGRWQDTSEQQPQDC